MIRFVWIIHPRNLSLLFAMCILYVATASALAHVNLDSPNGGESLTGGTNFQIEWRPQVGMHDTLNFDLWYSVTSNAGPWTAIALDLPPVNLAVGSLHTHSWLVPNINDASAWIRVRQENNVDTDYEDVSDSAFSIAAAVGLPGDNNRNGRVDAADYVAWRKTDNLQPGYETWRINFGRSSGAASAGAIDPVPEPATLATIIFVVGLARREPRSALP